MANKKKLLQSFFLSITDKNGAVVEMRYWFVAEIKKHSSCTVL